MLINKTRSGFTLIELLVVIAIIAVLAAILFPVFARVKERSRATACLNNMKQLGIAITLYCDNWNGCFPDHTSVGLSYTGTTYNDGIGGSWITRFAHRYRELDGRPGGIGLVLGKYTKNMKVFKCPSEWRKKPANVFDWLDYEQGSTYYVKHGLCYYANYYKRPASMSNIMYLTRAAMMYEAAWHSGGYPYIWDVAHWASVTDRSTIRINCIFFDSHVGNIDLKWNPVSAYDGNWYLYVSGWDLEKGARDR